MDRLPRPAKIAGFMVAGAARERMRYGRSLDRLVSEATARESWSRADLTSWQSIKLEQSLAGAHMSVPAYRRYWDEQARAGQQFEPSDLSQWPVLRRETVRADSGAFIADAGPRLTRFTDQTSGSTGSPLHVTSSFAVQREWYALVEARMRRWNGVSRTDRWAIFGGRLVAPVSQDEPPYWIWNPAMRQLYCSAYHISPRSAASYLDALRKHRITYLVGYPSALAALAECSLEQDLHAPAMRTVIANAEPLHDTQRAVIERCFDSPVRNTYGMAEIVAAASECRSGTMHLWPEVGVVEVLDMDSDTPAVPGVPGRLVLTGLINPVMPLIRYDIGDVGFWIEKADPCGCGRSLPPAPQIEGRLDDAVVTASGRRVGRLDKIITPDLPVREAQIVQESLEHFVIRIVPSSGWTPKHATILANSLRSRIGEAQVEIILVDAIERSKNGKFRTVVSAVQDL